MLKTPYLTLKVGLYQIFHSGQRVIQTVYSYSVE